MQFLSHKLKKWRYEKGDASLRLSFSSQTKLRTRKKKYLFCSIIYYWVEIDTQPLTTHLIFNSLYFKKRACQKVKRMLLTLAIFYELRWYRFLLLHRIYGGILTIFPLFVWNTFNKNINCGWKKSNLLSPNSYSWPLAWQSLLQLMLLCIKKLYRVP